MNITTNVVGMHHLSYL